jgi:hypothetical protein
LFSLGYAERGDLGTRVSSAPLNRSNVAAVVGSASNTNLVTSGTNGATASLFDVFSSKVSIGRTPARSAHKLLPRSTLKICVLGDNGVGKSSFVWNISGVPAPGVPDVEKGVKNAKSQDTVIIGGVCVPLRGRLRFTPFSSLAGGGGGGGEDGNDSGGDRSSQPGGGRRMSDAEGGRRGTDSILGADSTLEDLNNVCYLCVSAIPRDQTASWFATNAESCDMALLMFDCGSEDTFNTAVAMEQSLPDGMPRLFLGSKSDLGDDEMAEAVAALRANRNSGGRLPSAVQSAAFHVQQHDLLPVLQTSVVTGEGIREVLSTVRDVALVPLKAVPVSQRPGPPAASAFYPSLLKASCYAASLVGALYLLNAQFGVAKLVGSADLVRRARRWLSSTCGPPLVGNIPYLAALFGLGNGGSSTRSCGSG